MIENQSERLFNSEDFRASLEKVLSRPLTPENINSYTNDMIAATFPIVDSLLIEYVRRPTIISSRYNVYENVKQAFRYFDMGDLGEAFINILEQGTKIYSVRLFIASPFISIPPEEEEKGVTAHRLKSALFVLERDFGVDLFDAEQLEMSHGNKIGREAKEKNALNQSTYTMLKLPKLERIIFVSDKDNNSNTHVFNSTQMERHDVPLDELVNLSQSSIYSLLNELPELGQVVAYSNYFFEDTKEAIARATTNEADDVMEDSPSELIPTGYLSSRGIKKEYGLEHTFPSVLDAISRVDTQLGEVRHFAIGSRDVAFYSPRQIETIVQSLDEVKKITQEVETQSLSEVKKKTQLPYGYLTLPGIVRRHGSSPKTINTIIGDLAETLGEVRQFPVNGKLMDIYSPEQISLIVERFTKGDPAPEGYIPLSTLQWRYHLTPDATQAAIEQLGGELGEVRDYKFSTQPMPGYSPEQVVMIVNTVYPGMLTESGKLSPEHLLKGYLNVEAIVRKYGVRNAEVESALRRLADSIGEAYRSASDSSIKSVYSPEQITHILNDIARQMKGRGAQALRRVILPRY